MDVLEEFSENRRNYPCESFRNRNQGEPKNACPETGNLEGKAPDGVVFKKSNVMFSQEPVGIFNPIRSGSKSRAWF